MCLTRRGRTVLAATVAVVGAAVVAAVAVGGGPEPWRSDSATPGAGPGPETPPTEASPSWPWSPAVPAQLPQTLTRVRGDDLVAEAPIIVVADLTDRLDRDVATWLAVRLQAPLHHAAGNLPPAHLVVAVGSAAAAITTDAAVREVQRDTPTPGAAPVDLTAAPAELHRAEVLAQRRAPPVAVDLTEVEDLLDAAEAPQATGATLLVRPGGPTTAEVVTGLALGHRVTATAAEDPRADPDLITALAEAPEGGGVAFLGDGWAGVDRGAWGWQLEVARTGVQLPGGGQVMFPHRRLVALYGHPQGGALGVLGEQPATQAVDRARELAAEYDQLVDEPVIPAFEIIATVASGSTGAHGDYSRRSPMEELRPWVDAARDADLYVVLDLQPGRTDFLTQAREYEELLLEPHVGLALDPEWRLEPGQRHLRQIGSVTGEEVNTVITWLADLTREHALPQKLLIVHQFKPSMIRDRRLIDPSREELAVLIQMDGQGSQGAKLATYANIVREAPDGIWWGWKNFFDEDHQLRSPADTVALDPTPWFVSYQ